MYESFLNSLKEPRRLIWYSQWLYHRRIRGRVGIDVPGRDWDNLILLDACRYDMYERRRRTDNRLREVISRGSTTYEFLHNNFEGEYPEIVYVSASAQIAHLDATFHERIRLWEHGWDEDLETVPPEVVKQRALEASENFPDKRIIVHFIQPHYPFIGPTGREIDHRGYRAEGKMIWDRLANGELSVDRVRAAYDENLEITLPHVEELTEELPGKTVVTSDHGNEFGRWGLWGHPGRKFTKGLVHVPWEEFDTDERKPIVAGDATAGPKRGSELVEERLEKLGYIE